MLRAEGLAAFRGERLVFRDLSFHVPPGGALLLSGPNGAGKSSLLRLLAGLLRPIAGRLLWGDEDALADLPAHAARLAYVGHLDAVKPGLTVAENLRFAAAIGHSTDVGVTHVGVEHAADPTRHGWRASARHDGMSRAIAHALDALGLADLAELPARMLSAGQKRRLALARLALGQAPLWLLDEPTLGLDTASIDRFGTLLAAHRARGGMVVAATHLPLPLPDAAALRLG